MQQFSQADTTAEMIFTLNEKITINAPYFLFVFTHVLTKDTVKFIKAESDDESSYQSRYNKFTIDASIVFLNMQPGEWHYKIYEQASSTNTVVASAGTLLESGKLLLDRSTEFGFTKYDNTTTFKTYNG